MSLERFTTSFDIKYAFGEAVRCVVQGGATLHIRDHGVEIGCLKQALDHKPEAEVESFDFCNAFPQNVEGLHEGQELRILHQGAALDFIRH